jgi:hypothetical protein
MLIEHAFAEAVKLNPTRNLSSFKIPPDLIQAYEDVRKKMLGGLVVHAYPPESSIMLLQTENNIELVGVSPAYFNDLLAGEYNILISKPKYDSSLRTIQIEAGKTDTIRVTLFEQKVPIYKKWWAWGGSIALATAISYFTLVAPGETTPPESNELPPPVIHPKP